MKRTVLAFATIAIAAAVSATSAAALDRRVNIHNNSHQTLYALYGSHRDARTWEEDILGNSVIDPHGSVRVDFNDGSGYCIFDVKAVWADGSEARAMGQNICEITDLTFNN